MTAAPAYASFGRRVAALAIDGVVLVAALAAVIVAVNAAFGPVLATFWGETPARIGVEVASRTSVLQDDGTTREATVSRETRLYADGTVRIYSVAEGRFTAPDGSVTTNRVENLIGRNARDLLRGWMTGALAFALSFLYFAVFEASAAQATPGKTLLGLRVTDRNGRKLGMGRSLFRQLMKCAEISSSGITYIIAAFTERRQALHDMFAGTIVTHAPRAAAAPRRAIAF